MVSIEGNILLDFDFIHAFQNRQSMSHTADAHFLQLVMLQGNEGFTDNPILCVRDYG